MMGYVPGCTSTRRRVYSTPRKVKVSSLTVAGGSQSFSYRSLLHPQSTAVPSENRMSAHQTAWPQLRTNSVDTCLIVTVVSLGEPMLTPDGSLPKAIFTLSPSSSPMSWVAVKVKVFDVSDSELNVTVAGTPE